MIRPRSRSEQARRPRTWLASARSLSCAVLLVAAGCGYRHEPLFPKDVGTVAVPIFENLAYYKDVEFALTEAVVKEIEWRTPFQVAREGAADSVLNGEIVRITQSTLSRRRRGGLPQDVEYRIIVNFEWKDLRSGKILRQRRGMEIAAPYSPAREIGQTISLGQRRAVQRVAERVVDIMRTDL